MPPLKKVKEVKRKKGVMDLTQKLKILDLLKQGEKIAKLARRFNINESTIRSIRDNEEKIRRSFGDLTESKVLEVVQPQNDQSTAEEIEEILEDPKLDEESNITKDQPVITLSTVTRALTAIQSIGNQIYSRRHN